MPKQPKSLYLVRTATYGMAVCAARQNVHCVGQQTFIAYNRDNPDMPVNMTLPRLRQQAAAAGWYSGHRGWVCPACCVVQGEQILLFPMTPEGDIEPGA